MSSKKAESAHPRSNDADEVYDGVEKSVGIIDVMAVVYAIGDLDSIKTVSSYQSILTRK